MSAHSDNLKVSVSVRAESRWRHRDRGTNYTVLAVGRIQSKFWIEPSICPEPGPVDMRSVVVYRSEEDGAAWVRPVAEFMDGRFEALSFEPEAKGEAGNRTRLDLGNLLAIIHRAGGHYELEHGTAKAVEEAHRIIGDLLDQAREAGAGPVGEAVTVSRSDLIAWAEEYIERESDGETDCVTPFDRYLYAHPVEDPGKVARLTRERAQSESDHATTHTKLLDAEAALAETRERLEQVTSERNNALAAAKMLSGLLSSAKAALSKQESSATLAGDEKEGA